MIGTLGIGGSQMFVMNLYREIDKTQVQFDFIVDHPQATHFIPEIESMGGKVYELPLFNGKNLLKVRKAWDQFFSSHPEYKVLHSHVRSYASIYIPIAKAHGVKTIIHSHATSNGKGIAALMKGVLQFPLRFQADYYMACSYAAGKWLFGKRICKTNRFLIIKNAINTRDFIFSEQRRMNTRKELGISNQFVLGFLARVSEAKNPLFVIDVMKWLLDMDDNSLLLFVGDGTMLSSVKKKAVELGIDKNVIFTGARSDVSNMLAAMDCYILPSFWEGLGISLIEAQAAGLQCICSDAIQDEAILTKNVERCALDMGAEFWAKRICEMKSNRIRLDCSQYIKDSGFDIVENANFMQNFYLDFYK